MAECLDLGLRKIKRTRASKWYYQEKEKLQTHV